jgi:hypothetical protein
MTRTDLQAIAGDLDRTTGLLVRGDRPDIVTARRILAAVRRAVRRALDRPRVASAPVAEQLAVALRYRADTPVDCPMGCPVKAVFCVARQIASELEVGKGPVRPPDAVHFAPRGSGSRRKRGSVASFVQCRTELCATGAEVRGSLGDTPEAVRMARDAPRASDTSNG